MRFWFPFWKNTARDVLVSFWNRMLGSTCKTKWPFEKQISTSEAHYSGLWIFNPNNTAVQSLEPIPYGACRHAKSALDPAQWQRASLPMTQHPGWISQLKKGKGPISDSKKVPFGEKETDRGNLDNYKKRGEQSKQNKEFRRRMDKQR